MGNKNSFPVNGGADRSFSWQPEPIWMNGPAPQRRRTYHGSSDSTLSHLTPTSRDGFGPPPWIPPPDYRYPPQNGSVVKDDEAFGGVQVDPRRLSMAAPIDFFGPPIYEKHMLNGNGKPSGRKMKFHKRGTNDSGYQTTQENITDSDRSNRARMHGSRLSLNEAAFMAAREEPNGFAPPYHYQQQRIDNEFAPQQLSPYGPPPFHLFPPPMLDPAGSLRKKPKKRWSKKQMLPPPYYGSHAALNFFPSGADFGPPPPQFARQNGVPPPFGSPQGGDFVPPPFGSQNDYRFAPQLRQRSRSIENLVPPPMHFIQGPIPPVERRRRQQHPLSSASMLAPNRRFSSTFDVSEFHRGGEAMPLEVSPPRPRPRPQSMAVPQVTDGLPFRERARSPPQRAKSPGAPVASAFEAVVVVERPEVASRGDDAEPTRKAEKKGEDGFYETLNKLKVEAAAETTVRITPEAQAVMERNAALLHREKKEEEATTSPSKRTASASSRRADEPKAEKPTAVEATERIENEVTEAEITAILNPVLPRRKVRKPRDLDPMAAWKSIDVAAEVADRHYNKPDDEFSIDAPTVDEKIGVHLVPVLPSKKERGEAIYIEYEERLPEFKKRLIETGSFDYAEKQLSYSGESSSRRNSIGRSIEQLNVTSTPAKHDWRAYVAPEESHMQEMRKFSTDISKRFGSNEDFSGASGAYFPSKAGTQRSGGASGSKASLANLKRSITNLFTSQSGSKKSLNEPPTIESLHQQSLAYPRGYSSMDASKFNSLRSLTPSTANIRSGADTIDFSWVTDLEQKFVHERDLFDKEREHLRAKGALLNGHTIEDLHRRSNDVFVQAPCANRVETVRERSRPPSRASNRDSASYRDSANSYPSRDPTSYPQRSQNGYQPPRDLIGYSQNGYATRDPPSYSSMDPPADQASYRSPTPVSYPAHPKIERQNSRSVYKRLEAEVADEPSFEQEPPRQPSRPHSRASGYAIASVRETNVDNGELMPPFRRLGRRTPCPEPEPEPSPRNRIWDALGERHGAPPPSENANNVRLKAALFEQEARRVEREMRQRDEEIQRLKKRSRSAPFRGYSDAESPSQSSSSPSGDASSPGKSPPFIPKPDYVGERNGPWASVGQPVARYEPEPAGRVYASEMNVRVPPAQNGRLSNGYYGSQANGGAAFAAPEVARPSGRIQTVAEFCRQREAPVAYSSKFQRTTTQPYNPERATYRPIQYATEMG